MTDPIRTVRQRLLRHFPHQARANEPDDDVATAVYFMLWSMEGVSVDGWRFFRVVRESDDCLEALGLMTLLPTGSVPICVTIKADENGLAWSARAGVQDRDWLALSDSKRWNSVYLYATGEREEPQWEWDRECQGQVRADISQTSTSK